MSSTTGRLVLAALAITLVVAGWPAAWGGATSYVVVWGESMDPAYRPGDLVVTRAADRYEVGDVITFRTGYGEVIHRVVGGDARDGFRTQGDNVDRVDPYRPRPADVRGRAVLHVPAVGAWGLALAAQVPGTLLLVAVAAVAGLGWRRRHHQRQRPAVPSAA